MTAKDRLKKALDSINGVLREVQRLQPTVPPLSPRVRNQLHSTTRKLKEAASEIETVMRELDLSCAEHADMIASSQPPPAVVPAKL
jgi:predicted  nucleic acid-binding Zn-ribbon protein